MKPSEILAELLRGRLLLVGEYRGSRAELTGYVDHKSGERIQYVRALHLAECACRGNLDRAIIFERLPEAIETPEEAMFDLIKGRKYLFYLESLKCERGRRSRGRAFRPGHGAGPLTLYYYTPVQNKSRNPE